MCPVEHHAATTSPCRPTHDLACVPCAPRAVAIWPGELEVSLWSICVCPQDPQGDDFEIDVYPRVVSLTLRCRMDAPPAPGPRHEVPVTKPGPHRYRYRSAVVAPAGPYPATTKKPQQGWAS